MCLFQTRTPPLLIVVLFLTTACTVAALVDNAIRIIPNEFTLAVFFAGILLHLLSGNPFSLAIGLACMVGVAAIFFLTMAVTQALSGTRGVGAGDIKFAMVAAFIAGYPQIVLFLMGLTVSSLAYFGVKLTKHNFSFMSYFPMCAFIATGLGFALLGPSLPVVADYFGMVMQ